MGTGQRTEDVTTFARRGTLFQRNISAVSGSEGIKALIAPDREWLVNTVRQQSENNDEKHGRLTHTHSSSLEGGVYWVTIYVAASK